MKIAVLSVSKYRVSARQGDDVPLLLPGHVFGVFDGATDPRGTIVEGIGAGRLAALTVAGTIAELALEPGGRDLPADAILARVSEGLVRRTGPLDLPIPPSTTMAIAFDCGSRWRFVAMGDTGIRINGNELLRREKLIDDISTCARVEIFKVLTGAGPASDETEAATRRAILLGLDLAVTERVLRPEVAAEIIDKTIWALDVEDRRAAVEGFLRGGIKTQHEFGNRPDTPLGFDTLNGSQPRRGELFDVTRPKSEVRSIEIFTDGYPDLPTEVSVQAWEEAFDSAEAEDIHKIGKFATVKGSTSTEFFDDRTVVIISDL